MDPAPRIIKRRLAQKRTITVELKKEIIEKHDSGMRVTDLSKLYRKSSSTICSILKNKNVIRNLDTAKGVTRVAKQRHILEDVEKLLLVWINEKQLTGNSVTKHMICDKAKAIYDELAIRLPEQSNNQDEIFKASRGWFGNFKKRSGIQNVKKRYVASVNVEADNLFISDFKDRLISEDYKPQQVFNCNDTMLCWKEMPNRTYVKMEENAMPGHVRIEDRLTLLLCANASGDFKVKPLLVYHTEDPEAFRECKVQKSQLNVMWRSSSTIRITRTFFVEWINEVFGPAVYIYLLENNLPLKVLLVMNNTPAHCPGIEDDILEEFEFIKFKFFSSGISQLLQPMNQHIVSTFKLHYIHKSLKLLFQRCFEGTVKSEFTTEEFWYCHFHIVNCLNIIDETWHELDKKVLNSFWKTLWPDCVIGSAYELNMSVVDEILNLGKIMNSEIKVDELLELAKENNHELTIDELMNMHSEQQKTEKMSTKQETPVEFMSSEDIRRICKMWDKVQNFVIKHHSRKYEAMRSSIIFNDNVMAYFQEILKARQTEKPEKPIHYDTDQFAETQLAKDNSAYPVKVEFHEIAQNSSNSCDNDNSESTNDVDSKLF